ncbi:MAG TPA: enolase C-terminal domain-like protein, partial [Isosphaeraceae bacterium]|nr:enolase C-terminal domain-like protein [Isosphaeraceae bacterium]
MSRRVERVGLVHVEIPFKTAPTPSEDNAPVRASILVAIETGDGVIGYGESAPAINGDQSAAIGRCWKSLEETILPTILGKTFEDLEDIHAVQAGWTDVPASASAGAETALWDLVGQQAQVPLSEMLGASPMRIEAGVESGLVLELAMTVTDLLRSAESHLQEGYRRLTIPIAPGRDLEFVEAVRRAHPDLPLAVDAGLRFSPKDASLFRKIDELMPLWISEPWSSEDVKGLRSLQNDLMNPISLDAGH